MRYKYQNLNYDEQNGNQKYIEDLTWVFMFYWFYETSWGKEIIFISSRNDLNKFNKTGAQMFDSIYHMTLKIAFLMWKHQDFLLFYAML